MRAPIGTLLLLIHASVTLHTKVVSACNTPVFRYALERWQPDNYEIIVLHRQPLTDEQNQLLELLRQAARDEDAPANMTVRTVDQTRPLDEGDQQLLSAASLPEQSPGMLIRYPVFTDTDRLAFSGPFDSATVRALIDSPARRAVVERIAAGDSVVWVLIECGDSAKDDAAEQVLRQRLDHVEKTLQLPGPVDNGVDALFPPDKSSPETTTDTTLRLTLIRVSQEVPEERVFVSLLINSETDLHEYNEPIAIPLFGRARSHYALVGKGINDDNIDQSCQFLCGACSCEVKMQNPGADMLVRANWEELVGNFSIDVQSLPPLTGVGAFEVSELPASVAVEPMPITTKQDESSPPAEVAHAPVSDGNATATAYQNPIHWSVIVIVMLGLLVVSVGSILIKSRQKTFW